MLLPLGLLLIVAAWFKGDRLGLWIFMLGGFVLQSILVIAALLKYGMSAHLTPARPPRGQ
jgi:hypothetical protein